MFRFTIRELVLVTLVVALAAGWWVDRSRLAALLMKEADWKKALSVQPIPVDYLPTDNPILFRD